MPQASVRYGAISMPTAPNPMTIPVAGRLVASNSSRLVMYSTVSMPGVAGTLTVDPVAMTM